MGSGRELNPDKAANDFAVAQELADGKELAVATENFKQAALKLERTKTELAQLVSSDKAVWNAYKVFHAANSALLENSLSVSFDDKQQDGLGGERTQARREAASLRTKGDESSKAVRMAKASLIVAEGHYKLCLLLHDRAKTKHDASAAKLASLPAGESAS